MEKVFDDTVNSVGDQFIPGFSKVRELKRVQLLDEAILT